VERSQHGFGAAMGRTGTRESARREENPRQAGLEVSSKVDAVVALPETSTANDAAKSPLPVNSLKIRISRAKLQNSSSTSAAFEPEVESIEVEGLPDTQAHSSVRGSRGYHRKPRRKIAEILKQEHLENNTAPRSRRRKPSQKVVEGAKAMEIIKEIELEDKKKKRLSAMMDEAGIHSDDDYEDDEADQLSDEGEFDQRFPRKEPGNKVKRRKLGSRSPTPKPSQIEGEMKQPSSSSASSSASGVPKIKIPRKYIKGPHGKKTGEKKTTRPYRKRKLGRPPVRMSWDKIDVSQAAQAGSSIDLLADITQSTVLGRALNRMEPPLLQPEASEEDRLLLLASLGVTSEGKYYLSDDDIYEDMNFFDDDFEDESYRDDVHVAVQDSDFDSVFDEIVEHYDYNGPKIRSVLSLQHALKRAEKEAAQKEKARQYRLNNQRAIKKVSRKQLRLYRYSRKDLATALFSHIVLNQDEDEGNALLSDFISDVYESNKWIMCNVGDEIRLDLFSLNKEILAQYCIEYGVQLRKGKKPTFLPGSDLPPPAPPLKKEKEDPRLKMEVESKMKFEMGSNKEKSSKRVSFSHFGSASPSKKRKKVSKAAPKPRGVLVLSKAKRAALPLDTCICDVRDASKYFLPCAGGEEGKCRGHVHPGCIGLNPDNLAKSVSEPGWMCPVCTYAAEGKEMDMIRAVQPGELENGGGATRQCALCKMSDETKLIGNLVGPFICEKDGYNEYWCHRLCALAAKDAGITPEGGFYNVTKEINAAINDKCCLCNLEGASVVNNSQKYHLPCFYLRQETPKYLRRTIHSLKKLPHPSEPAYMDTGVLDQQVAIINQLKQDLI